MRAKFKILADALLALDTWEMRRLCEALVQNFSFVLDDDVDEELRDALLDFAYEHSVPFTEPAHAPAEKEYNPVRSYRRVKLGKLSNHLTREPL